jgi:GAF domain-containing protein
MLTDSNNPYRSLSPEHEALRQLASGICANNSSPIAALRSFGRLILEYLADLFAVDLVEDDGSIKRYVTIHVDSKKQERFTVQRDEHPVSKTSAYGYPRVIKTGKSQFIPGVTVNLAYRLLSSAPIDEDKPVPVRSFICFPLIAHGRTLGAVSVANTDRNGVFSADDLLLLEEIGKLIAQCLDDRE